MIEVEARVGDAIAQMTLTAAAVRMLGDAGNEASATIGNESDGRTLSGRLSGLRNTLSNMGDRGPLGTVIRGFGNLASAMLGPIDLGFQFAQNFEKMGTVAQGFIGIVASLGIGLVGFAATIAAVTFAATALASILGTLVAITADLVAPVTLLLGLLGGLGAAFVIGGKRAAEGGGKLNAFSKIVDTLGSMFGRTSNILAHVFLPYFVELGHAAERALNFLDKIIKLPLGQAFHELDTQGTKMLGQFVDRVAEVLSKPVRLAFKVAFDDTAFSNMVSDWWHRFVGFLFGSVEHHPIEVRPGFFKMQNKTVDGVFQPFIDWFNRHHFTQQGIKIGRQILAGVMNSGMRDRMSSFFAQVFHDAAIKSLHAFWNSLNRPLVTNWTALGKSLYRITVRALGAAWDWVKQKSGAAWNWISDKAGGVLNAVASKVKGALGSAWDWVKQKVGGIWDWIVQKITSPLHISIDWPSPPSWVTDWIGGGAGGGGGPIHPNPGGNPNPGFVTAGFRPSVAMAGPPVVVQNFHFHGADFSDAPTRRRFAGQMGKEVAADWRRRAGGH